MTDNPAPTGCFTEDDLVAGPTFKGVTTGLAWGDNLMFSLVTFEPDGFVPEHHHPHEQAGICLEGEFELVVEGRPRIIKPGQMYLIPGNTPHAARGLAAPAKTLDVFSPPREDYKPSS